MKPNVHISFVIGSSDDANGVELSSALRALELAAGVSKQLALLANHGKPTGIRWQISAASTDSPLTIGLGCSANVAHLAKAAGETFAQGLAHLETDASIPGGFDVVALRKTRDMVSVFAKDGGYIEVHSANGLFFRPTMQTVANIDRVLHWTPLIPTWGTSVGRLDVLNFHTDFSVTLYPLSGARQITCRMRSEDKEAAKALSEKVVWVYGKTEFDSEDEAKTVHVEDFGEECAVEVPPESTVIDITGGLSAVDYVQRVRSGE
jgi:hypothetical protein